MNEFRLQAERLRMKVPVQDRIADPERPISANEARYVRLRRRLPAIIASVAMLPVLAALATYLAFRQDIDLGRAARPFTTLTQLRSAAAVRDLNGIHVAHILASLFDDGDAGDRQNLYRFLGLERMTRDINRSRRDALIYMVSVLAKLDHDQRSTVLLAIATWADVYSARKSGEFLKVFYRLQDYQQQALFDGGPDAFERRLIEILKREGKGPLIPFR